MKWFNLSKQVKDKDERNRDKQKFRIKNNKKKKQKKIKGSELWKIKAGFKSSKQSIVRGTKQRN